MTGESRSYSRINSSEEEEDALVTDNVVDVTDSKGELRYVVICHF